MKFARRGNRSATAAAVLSLMLSAAAAQETRNENTIKEISEKYAVTTGGIKSEIIFYGEAGTLKSKRENDPAGEIIEFKPVPGRPLAFEGNLAGDIPITIEFERDESGVISGFRLNVQDREKVIGVRVKT
jgi:hypothetical protein